MTTFLLTLFIVICVLLIIVVLLQKGRGGGLSGAFGGGMASSAFGTRTGDVFTWVTIVLTGLFLLLAVVNSLVFRKRPPPVPNPIFQPAQGAIEKDTPVSISVRDVKASEDIRIYYTVDGSVPVEKAAGPCKEYLRNAVRVKPGQTLKARAFGRSREPSEVVSGFYGRPDQYAKETPAPTTEPETTSAPTTGSGPASKPASEPATRTRTRGPPTSRAATASGPLTWPAGVQVDANGLRPVPATASTRP